MKVFGVIGWKNSGKTGLMERLVSEISGRGITVSTVKHAHRAFDVDHPGKDSYRHREAGATEVMLSSRKRWALMHELRDAPELTLDAILAQLKPVQLVLIEGYKRDRHMKIQAHRAANGTSLLADEDAAIVCVASDVELTDVTVPVFDLNDTTTIADFILDKTGLRNDRQT